MEKLPGDAGVTEHRGTGPRGAGTAEMVPSQRLPQLTEAHPALSTTDRPSPLQAR